MMNESTLRIVMVVFLLAHGWMHLGLAQVPAPQPGGLRTPFFPSWWSDAVDSTWPVSRLGLAPQAARPLGWALWALAVAAYTVAAVALLLVPAQSGLWQGFLVGGSLISLATLGLYWHPWYPVGLLIDLALIAAVWAKLPLLRFGG